MKKQILLAGILLASVNATAESIPAICANVANYAAQTLDQQFTDGSWGDKHNPRHLNLNSDLKQYPVTKATVLGNCDEDGAKLKDSWCRVAGGSPDVIQLDIGKKELPNQPAYDFATVIVTFNRGGCHVASAELK